MTNRVWPRACSARVRRHWLIACAVPPLLVAGAAIVYLTGGTAYAWPYVMFVPTLLAAAWFHLPGGLAAGLLGGMLLGPAMPLEVATDQAQTTYNWLTRLAAFAGLGAFAGWLFGRLEHTAERHHRATRTDHETGLPNQAALHEDLGTGVVTAETDLQGRGTALILVRATDLAEAQEAFGTDAGEQIIPTLAARFRALDPRVQAVYRFSNSELAVRLERADATSLEAVTSDIAAAGEDHVPVRGIPVRIELAAGAGLADEGWVDGPALVRRARIALVAAWEDDRGHALYEPGIERGAAETVRLIGRLRTGLESGEFDLHYQPKIDLRTDEVKGYEGLLRWLPPDEGRIPPGQFMPKVESTSLIKPVTWFVTRTALDFKARHGGGAVSINFSVRNLFDPEIMPGLQQLLGEFGLQPEQVEIEITEGALMRNPGEAARLVAQMRDIGVGVSIDDFGTGYSSFEYLRRLPVTGLKIDRAFVIDIADDRRARDLLACMIDAGHALGLEVTAEGVETRAQHGILREIDCDVGQGFLYARPMPGAELESWLRQPVWSASVH